MGVIVCTYERMYLHPKADQWVISVDSKALHVCEGVSKPVATYAVGCWTQVFLLDDWTSLKKHDPDWEIISPTPIRNRDKTRRMDINGGNSLTRPVTR